MRLKKHTTSSRPTLEVTFTSFLIPIRSHGKLFSCPRSAPPAPGSLRGWEAARTGLVNYFTALLSGVKEVDGQEGSGLERRHVLDAAAWHLDVWMWYPFPGKMIFVDLLP